MNILLKAVQMFSFVVAGFAIGMCISPYLTNQTNIVRGDFKVFATLRENSNQLWVEVFNKKRGVGIAFSEDLFYIISMVVDETSNASLSINVPKLIPNDSMHPPERYCPKCGQDLIDLREATIPKDTTEIIKNLLIEKLKKEKKGVLGKMYRATLVFCNDPNPPSALNYLPPSLRKDMELQIEEVVPAILGNDMDAEWVLVK